MSWSASGTITSKEGEPTKVEITGSPQSGHGGPESQRALDAARTAAQRLIETGIVGEGQFRVCLSGHSNPENKPAAGWSNDFVSITIGQA